MAEVLGGTSSAVVEGAVISTLGAVELLVYLFLPAEPCEANTVHRVVVRPEISRSPLLLPHLCLRLL